MLNIQLAGEMIKMWKQLFLISLATLTLFMSPNSQAQERKLVCNSVSVARSQETCLSMAEAGDVKAQEVLGSYFSGVDDDASVMWFTRAALQGNEWSTERLRNRYWELAKKDPLRDDMVIFLNKVVLVPGLKKDLLAVAQAQLCQAYEEGIGVTIDYKHAAVWCERAAKNGSAHAHDKLIRFTKYGLGVPKSSSKAEAVFQDYMNQQILPISDLHPESVMQTYLGGSRLGICSANLRLADIYATGQLGVAASATQSKGWLARYEQCKKMG